MNRLLALVLVASTLALAACAGAPAPEKPRDYSGSKTRSDAAHGSLDKEASGY